MGVALVPIIHCSNRLVSGSIVHNELFVTTTYDANSRRHPHIVEGKGWDVLGRWVREGLQELK